MKKDFFMTLAGPVFVGIVFSGSGCRQKTETVAQIEAATPAATTEFSNHLDLEVVISVFGESANLEDFERRLNDPQRQISNLDLNEDGEVDYLRVVERNMEDTHLISVQAVLAEEQYQDVATFDVQRQPQGQTQVRVVGDPYIYGQDYAIQPTFSRPPVLLGLLWAAGYNAWRSPYRYGNYPSYYRPWRSYPYDDYRRRVNHYRNSDYLYRYEPYRWSKNSKKLYTDLHRNDYGSKHPGKSFSKRNKGVDNRYELDRRKGKAKSSDKKTPDKKDWDKKGGGKKDSGKKAPENKGPDRKGSGKKSSEKKGAGGKPTGSSSGKGPKSSEKQGGKPGSKPKPKK